MEYTYDQLKAMTVAEMRDIAAGIEHEAVQGYTQLNKEHLLGALCKALNIDVHTRHKSTAGAKDKSEVKAKMRALKAKRNEALEAHDHAGLKKIRRELHGLRRGLRRAAAVAVKK